MSTASNLEVLFEDNHVIAVNKRPSDIVQGDKTGDTPLSEIVKAWLKNKYSKPGNVFTGVVHRIDRPVSGVVVFAKTSKALARLNALFKTRDVQKVYWACVGGTPPDTQGILVHHLIKNPANNKSRPSSARNPEAKRSELHYQVLGHSERYTLLEVKPITGRHHQIRVQLSAAGFPIKGDLKYGSPRSNRDASIHLHARSLSLVHPVSQEKLTIVAQPPKDPVWDSFLSLYL